MRGSTVCNYIRTFNVHILSGGSVVGGILRFGETVARVAIVKNQPPDFIPCTRRAH